MAKPVVGTATGGIPEMLKEGTGLLAPPRQPDALARALIELLSDAALRRRLGQAARRRVERDFYEARLAEQVSEVYERLIQRPARETAAN
jgi:glycosyltransferase involved in cell wall biosynthesis